MYRVYGPGLPSEGKEMCKEHWEQYEAESDESESYEDESSKDRQEFTIRLQGHRAVPNTCEVCLAYAKRADIGKIKQQKVLMYRVYGPGLSENGKEVCQTHKEEYEWRWTDRPSMLMWE